MLQISKHEQRKEQKNMKKKILTAGMVTILAALTSIPVFASGWQKNETGWWWQNDDGSYPAGTYLWLDGNRDGIAERYAFDENGYLFTDTYIGLVYPPEDLGKEIDLMRSGPGIFYVNENGAVTDWTPGVGFSPQTKEVGPLESEWNLVSESDAKSIREDIRDLQAKGIHDYDNITDEEIARYTERQAEELSLELWRRYAQSQ